MENEDNVVKVGPTDLQPSEGEKDEEGKEDPAKNPQPGDKTEPNQLLKSLKDERERRRVAEDEARLLKEENEKLKNPDGKEKKPSAFPDDPGDGQKALKEVSSLKSEISEVKTQLGKKDVLETYPILKEKWEEFEAFRVNPENKGMALKTAAKAYVIENGLIDPPRKGLESPTGGDKTIAITGMTAEQVKDLRENNYKKYTALLKEGKIKIV